MKQLKKPWLTVIIIYIACFVFRIFEYFVLRTDQTFWNEAFVHKLAGIGIFVISVKLLSSRAAYFGFGKKGAVKYTILGVLFGLGVFFLAYGVEIFLSLENFQGLQFYVSRYAVDGNVGKETGFIFYLICILGNIINVVMEEGVFRGLFQKILQQKYTFLVAAIFSSVLFGLWHVIGPIRNYYDGLSSLGGMVANLSMLVITSTLAGFQFALLTKITGSLYMAMGAHFVNNTIVNLLHVISQNGADELMVVRITVAQAASFILVLYWYIRKIKRNEKAKA